MKHLFPLLLLVAMLLSSCSFLHRGKGPHGSETVVSYSKTLHRDVTFSVDFRKDINTLSGEGPDRVTERRAIAQIQKEFDACGMFGKVSYCPLERAGAEHFHFVIKEQGTSKAATMFRTFCTGISWMLIPSIYTLDYEWTMQAYRNKKELYTSVSEQEVATVLWSPLILVGGVSLKPAQKAGERACKSPIRYFLSEIDRHTR